MDKLATFPEASHVTPKATRMGSISKNKNKNNAYTNLSWSTTRHKIHVVKGYICAGVYGGLGEYVGSKSAEGTSFRSTPFQVKTKWA